MILGSSCQVGGSPTCLAASFEPGSCKHFWGLPPSFDADQQIYMHWYKQTYDYGYVPTGMAHGYMFLEESHWSIFKWFWVHRHNDSGYTVALVHIWYFWVHRRIDSSLLLILAWHGCPDTRRKWCQICRLPMFRRWDSFELHFAFTDEWFWFNT